MINIYTDGSAKGNGTNRSSGGFGVIVLNNDNNIILHKYASYSQQTTNNREELKAMIYAFQLAHEQYIDEICNIYTDSQYVMKSCNDWIPHWATHGWLTVKKQPVDNLDLMQEIHRYLNIPFFNGYVEKIKGHNGNIGNELADCLATNNLGRYVNIVTNYGLIEQLT